MKSFINKIVKVIDALVLKIDKAINKFQSKIDNIKFW